MNNDQSMMTTTCAVFEAWQGIHHPQSSDGPHRDATAQQDP